MHPMLQSEPEQKEKASHLMGVAQPLQKLLRYLFFVHFLFSCTICWYQLAPLLFSVAHEKYTLGSCAPYVCITILR